MQNLKTQHNDNEQLTHKLGRQIFKTADFE